MANTLVNFKFFGKGRFYPKANIASICFNLFNLAGGFYYSCKHVGKFRKIYEEFIYFRKSIIFAALSDDATEFFHIKEVYTMLIIDSKDCENIDKALKKYKKKFEKSRVLLQLRERQAFIKPSIRRRTEMLKAVYKQQLEAGKFD